MQLGCEPPLLVYPNSSSSSHMHVMTHNWSATKQCPHPQSVAETNHTQFCQRTGFDNVRHCPDLTTKTDQYQQVATTTRRHCSVPAVPENGPVETTASEGGQNPVAGLWGRTLGETWPPEPTSRATIYNGEPIKSRIWSIVRRHF